MISQRCVTVATWAGRGGVLMQCAMSSAQPRVAARSLANQIRATVPSLRHNMKNDEWTGGLVDFLCTLPLFAAFISRHIACTFSGSACKPGYFFFFFYLEHVMHKFAKSGTCFTFSSLSFLLASRRGSTPRGRAASSARTAAPRPTPPPTASYDR